MCAGGAFSVRDPRRARRERRFKVPTMRALSARAPYFHDGSAATLEDVVRHYEQFLGFVFTDQERADLVAFLAAL
jgi:cytochrome c peroxidase